MIYNNAVKQLLSCIQFIEKVTLAFLLLVCSDICNESSLYDDGTRVDSVMELNAADSV